MKALKITLVGLLLFCLSTGYSQNSKKDTATVRLSEKNALIEPDELSKLETIRKGVNTKLEQFKLNEESKKIFKNTKVVYKAAIYNTTLSIPVARFNFIKDDTNKSGNIQMFNSIGAGFGMSWGKMTDCRDANGNLESSDFANSFSLHLGCLFSTGNEGSNVFAPTVTLGLLDFQLGIGYELGDIDVNQNRAFLTLGYAIPIYKLNKGKYLFHSKGEILNEVYLSE
jgi:hypothetical protein